MDDEDQRDPHSEMMRILTQTVHALGKVLPPGCEVILHDLRKLPNSIVAIEGSLTNREVGSPATDLLLREFNDPNWESHSYETTLPSGQRISSMTTIYRTPEPVAALCLNFDITGFDRVRNFLSAFMVPSEAEPQESGGTADALTSETFVHDVDELSELVLSRAIERANVPVHLMHKRHKKEVVRTLAESGFFTLRESEERAAAALGVTRFTVYRYLNELRNEAGIQTARASRDADS